MHCGKGRKEETKMVRRGLMLVACLPPGVMVKAIGGG